MEIDVDELARWRAEAVPHVLLDVREAWEVRVAAIDGSNHVPMERVPEVVESLPSDRAVVVMCHHGIRSARVVAFPGARGDIRALNLAGGIDAWSQWIEPSVPRY